MRVGDSQNSKPKTHPVLNSWVLNRELVKIEEAYAREWMGRGGKRISISSRIRNLRAYVRKIKSVYEGAIASGDCDDTPDLWAAVYLHKILPSTFAKINSLLGSLAFLFRRIGGGTPNELASAEEARRDLSRLKAELESELQNALVHLEQAGAVNNSKATGLDAQIDRSQTQIGPKLLHTPVSLRSPLKRAISFFLSTQPNASNKEILSWLEDANPKVIPKSWQSDSTLPGKVFAKVRRILLPRC
jgi:hypothetical protein